MSFSCIYYLYLYIYIYHIYHIHIDPCDSGVRPFTTNWDCPGICLSALPFVVTGISDVRAGAGAGRLGPLPGGGGGGAAASARGLSDDFVPHDLGRPHMALEKGPRQT